jgi:flagellar biosynthesis protein FlhA
MSSVAVPRSAASGRWARVQELILPVAIVASVLVILAPVPAGWMDLLLSANITIAVVMLLTTLYVRTPLEFNVFPSLLLATTLFRLVLNVATTRLILSRAAEVGETAAGQVVLAFGKSVTGGDGTAATDNIVVGLVIFSIIVLIQFVVITKGATRISEVAARFTLDGMPGRQMAIDADLAAGAIDQQEAHRRRSEIVAQADFFGAMDGASKFVRGDAVAAIAIIFINILGGLFIGIVQNGMGLAEAASLFTTLTIGDGLVTQVPALLISLAAGMLVTRTSQASHLPSEFLRQLFSRPLALAVAGGFLGLLLFTGLPRAPLLALGAGCIALAVVLRRRESQARAAGEKKQTESTPRTRQRVEDYLAVDPMEIELGVGLLRLADPRRGGDLLDRIQRVRQNLAAELGIVLPKVRVRDNLRLDQNQYRIKVADLSVAQGTLDEKTPDPGGALAEHLTDTVRRHADELLTRDAVKRLLDELRQTSPAAVDELIPGVMKLGEVQRVLQTLLREEVSIRPLDAIVETLADHASHTKDPILLAEHVRRRLGRAICSRHRDADGPLRVVTLDPAMEERIRTGVEHTEDGWIVRLSPQETDAICRALGVEIQKLASAGHKPIVLAASSIRPALRQLTAAHLPQLVMLGCNEIPRDTKIESVGMASEAGDARRTAGHGVPAPHFRRVDAAAIQVPPTATAVAGRFPNP